MSAEPVVVVMPYTATEYARQVVARILRAERVPVDAPAVDVDRVLRPHAPERPARVSDGYSYSTWRRAVRAVQAERAKWCRWEGRDTHRVEPRRRRNRL